MMLRFTGLLFACAVVTGVSSAWADSSISGITAPLGALESYAAATRTRAAPRTVARAAPRPVARVTPRPVARAAPRSVTRAAPRQVTRAAPRITTPSRTATRRTVVQRPRMVARAPAARVQPARQRVQGQPRRAVTAQRTARPAARQPGIRQPGQQRTARVPGARTRTTQAPTRREAAAPVARPGGGRIGARAPGGRAAPNVRPVQQGQAAFIQPGVRPQGVRPQGVRPQGVRPQGVRPQGVRPEGVRREGVRPAGIRPAGVRPAGRPPVALVTVNQRQVPIVRGPRVIYLGGLRRTLVPLTALGAITIANRRYGPDGYLTVARPVCRGTTEDGCTLGWRDVPTDDGGAIPQCVRFCAQVAAVGAPGSTPEVRSSARPPSLPAWVGGTNSGVVAPITKTPAAPADQPAATGCEIEVYTAANLAGQSATVTEDEPELSEDWSGSISSARVVAGAWDLFDEENFNGEAMRLEKGTYGTLTAGWDKRIRSMLCADPAL
jgi:hypothetical protein